MSMYMCHLNPCISLHRTGNLKKGNESIYEASDNTLTFSFKAKKIGELRPELFTDTG